MTKKNKQVIYEEAMPKEKNFLVSFLMFFVAPLIKAVKGLLSLIFMYALGYGGLMLYLDYNPEMKEKYDNYRATIFTAFDQLGQLTGNGQVQNGQEGGNQGVVSGFGGMISPELIQSVMGQMNNQQVAVAQEAPMLDPNAIAKPLLSVDKVLQKRRDYQKLRKHLIVAKAGESGNGAVKLLDKMLASKNNKIAEAAYNALVDISTADSLAILRKHGY